MGWGGGRTPPRAAGMPRSGQVPQVRYIQSGLRGLVPGFLQGRALAQRLLEAPGYLLGSGLRHGHFVNCTQFGGSLSSGRTTGAFHSAGVSRGGPRGSKAGAGTSQPAPPSVAWQGGPLQFGPVLHRDHAQSFATQSAATEEGNVPAATLRGTPHPAPSGSHVRINQRIPGCAGHFPRGQPLESG